MTDMAYAAIAKVTLHQREHTAILRPFQHGLILHTLYYPKEIHGANGYGKTSAKGPSKQELELAEQFVKAMVKSFRPEQFRDEYAERVTQLIESKGRGKAAPLPEKAPRMAPVIDLMSALKKSLAEAGKSERVSKPKRLRKTA